MEKLQFINEQMTAISIPYQFGEWNPEGEEVKYPYFVGELPSPEDIDTESGKEETPLIVTGFHRGAKITLLEMRDKIKKHFYHGARAVDGNRAIAVFYNGSFFVPTNEADLHKIQIDLTIKEWKVY